MIVTRLKAAVFWSERWENDDGTYSNLRVTSSPQALKAYRSARNVAIVKGKASLEARPLRRSTFK
jgi:hypothetical protein